MERLIIRPARYNDVETMIGLLQELFKLEPDFTPDPVKQSSGLELLLSTAGTIIFVAEYDGKSWECARCKKVISTAEGG